MKYFTVSEPNGMEHGPYSSKRAVIACLESLASREGVEIALWWWSRDDLVDCEVLDPARFRATKAHDLTRGATAQWAAARGRL